MKSFSRICIDGYQVIDVDGNVAEVHRGKEYITSEEKEGKVTVFTNYWFKVPVSCFAGERLFTSS